MGESDETFTLLLNRSARAVRLQPNCWQFMPVSAGDVIDVQSERDPGRMRRHIAPCDGVAAVCWDGIRISPPTPDIGDEWCAACPDCNGSGVYVGLNETRPCPTCQGENNG